MSGYSRHQQAMVRNEPLRPSSTFWVDGFTFDGEPYNHHLRNVLLTWHPNLTNANDDSRTQVLKRLILLFRLVNHYLGFIDIPDFMPLITGDGGWPQRLCESIIKRYEMARRKYARQSRQIPANAGPLDALLCRLVDNYIDAKDSFAEMTMTSARGQHILEIRDAWYEAQKANIKAILDHPPEVPALPAHADWLPRAGGTPRVDTRRSRSLARRPSGRSRSPPQYRRSRSPVYRRSRSPHRYRSRSPPRRHFRSRSRCPPPRRSRSRHDQSMYSPIRYEPHGPRAQHHAPPPLPPHRQQQQQHNDGVGQPFRSTTPVGRNFDLPVRPSPSPDLESQHRRRIDAMEERDQQKRLAEAEAQETQRREIRQGFQLLADMAKDVETKVEELAGHDGLSAQDQDWLALLLGLQRNFEMGCRQRS